MTRTIHFLEQFIIYNACMYLCMYTNIIWLCTQLKMGWVYTLGAGVYIRKKCKSWNLSVSKPKGVSHNPLARGVIQ